jgi:hypothetical protein
VTTAYDVVYPKNGRLTLDGGKNSKFERSIIPDNESPDCYNVVFTNGAVATRGGTSKLNTAAIGSFAFDGLYTRRDNSGAETMIAFAGGTAWQLAGTTLTTIGSAQSVFTAGQRVATTQYENHMFIGNGGVTPYKWNGVAFTRHGVPQATGVVSAASVTSSTGQINGEARYKVAFVNSASVVGDVGTATVTLSVTNGKVHLTGIPVAPQSHGVNARRIYRNFVSGSTSTYGLLTTLSDNTTTTLVDNALDSSLGATPPTDNGEPPKYSIITQHQGRLFCNDALNPGFIWYSNLLEPFTFASTNFLVVGDATRDLPKVLDVYDNALFVGCEAADYLIYMPSTDPAEWQTVRIRSQYGTKSPFATFLFDNKLMTAAQQNSKFVGFAAIHGSALDPEATTLDHAVAGSLLASDRIEPDMFQVQDAMQGQISAMVFKNKAYISLAYGSDATANNRVYVFDFSISNLSKKQKASWAPLTGINAAQFTVYDGTLYYASSTANGFVYEMETDVYSDDSSAINSYYWTKEFSGQPGHENLEKDFREVKLLVDKAGAYYMTLRVRTDSDKGDGTAYQLDLNPGSSIWNAFPWGGANWGGGTDQEEITLRFGLRGKRIQLQFSNQNTAGQRFKVHGMNFRYNIKGKR